MASEQKPEGTNSPWRSALALGLVAVIGTSLLAGVNQLTKQRIRDQERRAALRQLGELIAPERYDNAFYDDHYSFADGAWFPGGQTVTVYRARKNTEPVAAVLRLAAADGYNGKIHLLVGINADGSLTGVRVTSHKETPGLGDAIESGKSDWILGFSGLSLRHPEPSAWAVKRDGGQFDQFTGATITPRAVVKAVRMALEFYLANKRKVFETAAEAPAS
jgi:electron transport complex protein RnfG